MVVDLGMRYRLIWVRGMGVLAVDGPYCSEIRNGKLADLLGNFTSCRKVKWGAVEMVDLEQAE